MLTHTAALPCGSVQGEDRGSHVVYRGIPYAAPPVGPLRWQAPRPHSGWHGVYDATRFKSRCWQKDHAPGDFYHREFYADPAFTSPCSEDCLHLNIWAPKSGGENLPVAVWLHGGAFLHGWGGEAEFDGAAYAARGVILVTLNYRVGIFGFFCHPALTARDGQSGNYGILDQIAALDWVRANIGALGGDAGNITVFGQSAGGMSVRTLASSPLAKGKFQRAIAQSSGGYRGPLSANLPMADMERLWANCLDDAGLAFEELAALPAAQLFAQTAPFTAFALPRLGMELCFVPVIGGALLPCGYDEAVDRGLLHDIPYITGCTRDDIGGGEMYDRTLDWCGRVKSPTYMYHFTRPLPGDGAGAFHSAELWYMFGTLGRCWRPMTTADKALSDDMLDCWTGFMKHGQPGGVWQPCTGSPAQVFDFE